MIRAIATQSFPAIGHLEERPSFDGLWRAGAETGGGFYQVRTGVDVKRTLRTAGWNVAVGRIADVRERQAEAELVPETRVPSFYLVGAEQ
jgi:hypothetical protein